MCHELGNFRIRHDFNHVVSRAVLCGVDRSGFQASGFRDKSNHPQMQIRRGPEMHQDPWQVDGSQVASSSEGIRSDTDSHSLEKKITARI